MIGGIQFPIAALAAGFLFLFVVPWLATRFGRWRDRLPLPRKIGVGALAVGALLVPIQWATPYYVQGLEWRSLRWVKYPAWLDADLVTSLEFLRSLGPPESIVVSSYETGNYIPPYTGHRTVLGHYALTIDSKKRGEEIVRFYAGGPEDDSWRREMMKKWGAKYVIHGRHERDLGDFDPSARSWLRRLKVAGEGRDTETAVYALEAPEVPAAGP